MIMAFSFCEEKCYFHPERKGDRESFRVRTTFVIRKSTGLQDEEWWMAPWSL